MPAQIICKFDEDPQWRLNVLIWEHRFSMISLWDRVSALWRPKHVTPKLISRSAWNSNSSKILRLFLSFASLMKIRSKWWRYHVHNIVSIISLWEKISTQGWRNSKSGRNLNFSDLYVCPSLLLQSWWRSDKKRRRCRAHNILFSGAQGRVTPKLMVR